MNGPVPYARVTVLIPTYRDAHLLRKSLPVFLQNPPRELEVVILNNDPSQDIRASVGDDADDPRVKIVEMGESYFSRAANRGIRESSGGLVMFCNADLFPTPTYLDEIMSFFDAHPRAGAAIGKVLRYDLASDEPTDVIDTAGLLLTRQRRIMTRGEGERDTGQFDAAREVFAIDGAAMVVRRRALEQIRTGDQYFDENFVTHKEDHDISWRVRLAGWECWYAPDAVAFHGRTTRGLGATGYLSAFRARRRNEREKSHTVRVHAMKNQWLMLAKNEDAFNFARDFPSILAREAMVLGHNLVFAPRSLVAIPMTLKILPDTLRKRRSTKAMQRMEPQALRRWIGARP
jgi:GT2 family glycosyltransferase